MFFFVDVQRGTADRCFMKTDKAHHRKNSNEQKDDMRRRNKGPEISGPLFFRIAAVILRQMPTNYDIMNGENL